MAITKYTKQALRKKWQIVQYNRLKPVKEQMNKRKVLTRPALRRRKSTGEAVINLELTASHSIFSKNCTTDFSSKQKKIQKDGGKKLLLQQPV